MASITPLDFAKLVFTDEGPREPWKEMHTNSPNMYKILGAGIGWRNEAPTRDEYILKSLWTS